MLTTSPHLRVRRPSPTTAEFTVTNLPPPTLPLRLLLSTVLLARLVLGCAAVLLLHAKYALSSVATPLGPYAATPSLFTNDFIWYVVYRVHTSRLGQLCTGLAAQIPTLVLIPIAAAVFYVVLLRIHESESVLVLRGLGIQTSSTADTYLASAVTRFIPTEKIQDILVNEAFRGLEVRYYLVVVVEGEDDVVVVFPRLLPRKKIVETVWRGVRGCLNEGDDIRKMDDKAWRSSPP
jgi:phosphatidylinositol N-acetylglucosaminyltransferase subunit H